MVAGGHLETEHRLEKQWLADCAGANVLENGDGSRFVVQAIRSHQEDVRLARGGDHRETFVFVNGERLLDHDMSPGARRSNGEIGMHVVGQGNVHGVDLGTSEERVVVVVSDNRVYAVELR